MMKTMQKFAAQQLTKKQMNEVKGGKMAFACTVKNQTGDLVAIQHVEYGDTLQDAVENMRSYLLEGTNNGSNCKFWEV